MPQSTGTAAPKTWAALAVNANHVAAALPEPTCHGLRDYWFTGDGWKRFDRAVGFYLRSKPERPTDLAISITGPASKGYVRIMRRSPEWKLRASYVEEFGIKRIHVRQLTENQAVALPFMTGADWQDRAPLAEEVDPLKKNSWLFLGMEPELGILGQVDAQGKLTRVDGLPETRTLAVEGDDRDILDIVLSHHADMLHAAGPDLEWLYAAEHRKLGRVPRYDVPRWAILRGTSGNREEVEFRNRAVRRWLRFQARRAGQAAEILGQDKVSAVAFGGDLMALVHQDVLDKAGFRDAFVGNGPSWLRGVRLVSVNIRAALVGSLVRRSARAQGTQPSA